MTVSFTNVVDFAICCIVLAICFFLNEYCCLTSMEVSFFFTLFLYLYSFFFLLFSFRTWKKRHCSSMMAYEGLTMCLHTILKPTLMRRRKQDEKCLRTIYEKMGWLWNRKQYKWETFNQFVFLIFYHICHTRQQNLFHWVRGHDVLVYGIIINAFYFLVFAFR